MLGLALCRPQNNWEGDEAFLCTQFHLSSLVFSLLREDADAFLTFFVSDDLTLVDYVLHRGLA